MNQTLKTTKFKIHELRQSVHAKTQNPLMCVIGAQTGSAKNHHLTIKTRELLRELMEMLQNLLIQYVDVHILV